jgi:N-acyl-D-aspartate/D-glutamate deacylase
LSASELRREGRSPSSLIYVPTGETIASEERLELLRELDPGGIVMTLTYDLDDQHEAALLDRALLLPEAAFASDAMPLLGVPAFAHPRTAGTFSRVFGWLVRQRGVLTLAEAVRRCTLVPANILAGTAPMMASKGRLQVGADADLTAFDPQTISDQSTYSHLRASVGVRHVVVAGRLVLSDGKLRDGIHPGRPIVGR